MNTRLKTCSAAKGAFRAELTAPVHVQHDAFDALLGQAVQEVLGVLFVHARRGSPAVA
jgi:hypothetical protein